MSYEAAFQRRIIEATATRTARTCGFEYELIGEKALTPDDFARVRGFLPTLGFVQRSNGLVHPSHLRVTFEPGGQIEFSSPPIRPDDRTHLDCLMDQIEDAVARIQQTVGVTYVPLPWQPGRATAVMLLDPPRYQHLHCLLTTTGDRGLEMMKGTAAIHLHVSLCSLAELLPMWRFLCELTLTDGFAMGAERRDIWNRTDPSRCGALCTSTDLKTSAALLSHLIEHALEALEIETGRPFRQQAPAPDVETFLGHFSTMFTDVRLNPVTLTLELRTPDTRSLKDLRQLWTDFTGRLCDRFPCPMQ